MSTGNAAHANSRRRRLSALADVEPTRSHACSLGQGVTAMEEAKVWWLLALVAFLGGVGMAFGW
jgi:hypothetical protein